MSRFLAFTFAIFVALSGCAAAAPFIVENGQPRAQIVIAKDPPRSTRLAAQELQTYVEKISGAKLPIVNEPRAELPIKIGVGRSPLTEKLKIEARDLHAGAYRIVAGDDWLVLIGDDTNFEPVEPWPKSAKESLSGQTQKEWEKITGGIMGKPNATSFKDRLRLPGETGLPTDRPAGKVEPLELWCYDERGSFNAVNGFLRSLGVRWFMPGEIGEVVPALKSIALPKIDSVVRPDFPVRQVNFRFAVSGYETVMWGMRLGLRDEHGLQTAHGMQAMTHRDEIFKARPEWFALYGGQRQTQPGQRLNQLCYSNEDLFRETVRNVRAQLDNDQSVVPSVMPPDGYGAICQCPLCQGKETPERGKMGHLSDYVWDFVNRVAKEVRQSHPGRMIANDAYGAYSQPPLKIAKLEPNVQVIIVGGRRPAYDQPEQKAEVRALRESWLKKTSNPLVIFENYPLTERGFYLPAFIPHALGAGINETKGISRGEDIWISVGLHFDKENVAFNSFLIYFTARMYWGGKGQDVDPLFREYCRLLFGPAENEMRAFYEYCEAHWQEIENDKTKADAALTLFAAAQKKAAAGSVEAQRIALVDDYLNGLRNKSKQLGQKRGPVPSLRIVSDTKGLVLDGKLDDAYWQDCPGSATCRLRELQTGRAPAFGTAVKAGWQNGSLYFAIRCDEPRGSKPNSTSTKRDDGAMWYGDVVEILLETESHAYYQIAFNPAGAIADLDRSAPKNAWYGWDSQAEVVTNIADDHWTAEVRIPVTDDDSDPLHQVVGHKPTSSLPWHINICRQRVRENGTELSAFSPTGTDNFHRELKFAHFYLGRNHQFEAAPTPDFLSDFQAAAELEAKAQHDAAAAAFAALAQGKITDVQKSAALEQAAASARDGRKAEQAAELAARIPIPAVRKVAQMENLLATRQAAKVVEQFGAEDLSAWPFWKRADGLSARGRAFAEVGDGTHAESDLSKAVELANDDLVRAKLWLTLGENREKNLKDTAQALAAYRQILELKKGTGTTTYFRSLQRAAELLNQGGKHDEAEAVLRRVNLGELRGSWRGTLTLALADTQKAAGRQEEARATYTAIANDESVEAKQRQIAQEVVKAMGK